MIHVQPSIIAGMSYFLPKILIEIRKENLPKENMCYPKPGPRCSAWAKKRLIDAKNKASNVSLFSDPESYDKAKAEVTEAKLDYDSTPAGQKYLQFRIDQKHGMRTEDYEERLANGKKLRKLQLDAIKAKDKGDINNHEALPQKWDNTEFQDASETRQGWSVDADTLKENIEKYETASLSAAHVLTPDQKSALTWITSDGGPFINKHLIEKHEKENGKGISDEWTWEEEHYSGKSDNYSKEYVQKKVSNLNGAFRKYSLEEPAVLYRGLNDWNFPDQLQSYNTDPAEIKRYLESKYKPGSTITIPEYMSTTADPGTATKFTGATNVVLEVKTKRAIPVGYSSAWGNSEREFVVNKNGKYRVKSILEDVEYLSSTRAGNEKYNKRIVVQLEEI